MISTQFQSLTLKNHRTKAKDCVDFILVSQHSGLFIYLCFTHTDSYISSIGQKHPVRNLERFLVRICVLVLTVASSARSVALSVLLSSTFFSRQEILPSLIFIVCWTVSSSRDSSSLYLLTYTQKKSVSHPSEVHFYT